MSSLIACYGKIRMDRIQKRLFDNQDLQYKEFQSKLMPNVGSDVFIGVRTPVLRKLAKEIGPDEKFLNTLPHKYFDENQIHSFMISSIKDYDEAIKRIDTFLPYVDNWATCDQLDNKTFSKNKDKLIKSIKKWLKSKEEYTIRFGVEMLMRYYLDDDFKVEYLDMVANIKSSYYYVNMMRAWYFATALAKKWDETIPYIENKKLDDWTHNMTIKKCKESYRISADQKDYLSKQK